MRKIGKRVILSLAVGLGIIGASLGVGATVAAFVAQDKLDFQAIGNSGTAYTIYLNASNNLDGNGAWTKDSPKMFVFVWNYDNQSVNAWYHGTVNASGKYEFHIPSSQPYDRCLFARVEPTVTIPQWGDNGGVWTQTVDEVLGDNQKNHTQCLYTITSWRGGADSKSTGTWGSLS